MIRSALEVSVSDVVEDGCLGVGTEGRLQVRVVGQVLRWLKQAGCPVLGVARIDVMGRPDVRVRIGSFLGMEGVDEVHVRGDVFQPVEGRLTTLEPTGLDVVAGARVGIGAKGADEIAVGRDVFQAIEGDVAPLESTVGDVASGSRVFVRTQHIH